MKKNYKFFSDAVLDAVKDIAKDYMTTQVDILKFTHPGLLVHVVCEKLGYTKTLELEYDEKVYNELRTIVKLTLENQFDKMPFIKYWGLVPETSIKDVFDSYKELIDGFDSLINSVIK